MSHVADVDLQIKDLDAVAKAADALGYELVRDKKNFRWYGRFMADWNDPKNAAALKGFDPAKFGQCDHVLRRKGATADEYEIGLVKHPDGRAGWVPMFDVWGVGKRISEAMGGLDMPELKKGYAREVASSQLRKQGYRVRIEITADGQVKVIGQK